MTVEEIPPVAISWGRTTVFKTGSWRNVTPHYTKRLPPCRAGCPVGNNIEGWLEAAGAENWDEAGRLLIEEQPLPSVCGRVCYHPCETSCNRGEFDSAVSIRAVERYLGDRASRLGTMPERRCASGSSNGRVLIVGSGPSGLTTAWLLARLGHDVEIYEKAPLSGGLLRYGIPDYRLPRKVLDQELGRLEKLGILIKNNIELSVNQNLNDLCKLFDAIYLAPGAAGHRSSGIRNSEGMVIGAIEFLAWVAEGDTVGIDPPLPPPAIAGGECQSLSAMAGGESQSLSAMAGGKRLVDPVMAGGEISKKVAVIGGGNSAIDAARTALRLGAEVTILYRRTRKEMPAYGEEIEAALEEGVGIEYLVSPVEFLQTQDTPPFNSPPGNRGGVNFHTPSVLQEGSSLHPPLTLQGGNSFHTPPILQGGNSFHTTPILQGGNSFHTPPALRGGNQRGGRLRCIRNRLGKPDASGRRRPEPIPGSEFEIPVDMVIDAVGEFPDPAQLTADNDEQNALKSIDAWGRTSIDGVWVGGDFTGSGWTVAHAIGTGKRAAIDIDVKLGNSRVSNPEIFLFGQNNSVSAHDYLTGNVSGRYDSTNKVEVDNLNLAYHPRIARTVSREIKPDVRKRDFSEIVKGLSERLIVREAGRCFHCGTCDSCGNCHIFCPDGAVRRDPLTRELSFDLEHCKGCGVCESECPRAAIEMSK